MEPTKLDMFREVVIRGALYHFIEVGLILFIAASQFIWGAVWLPVLWAGAIAASLWVLMASTGAAQDEAQTMVLDGDIYVTDWLMGAFFMCLLSVMASPYGLHLSALFFVAAVQNLRYTALSFDWLGEEAERVERKQQDRSD